MPTLDIILIDNDNINLVSELLYQRNATLKSYTKWKYSFLDNNRFKGSLALRKGKPIGCFGSIPKVIKFSNGIEKNCGWYAD